jgi:hypothetical protein
VVLRGAGAVVAPAVPVGASWDGADAGSGTLQHGQAVLAGWREAKTAWVTCSLLTTVAAIVADLVMTSLLWTPQGVPPAMGARAFAGDEVLPLYLAVSHPSLSEAAQVWGWWGCAILSWAVLLLPPQRCVRGLYWMTPLLEGVLVASVMIAGTMAAVSPPAVMWVMLRGVGGFILFRDASSSWCPPPLVVGSCPT